MHQKYFFASCLSSLGRGHVGALFNSWEQKVHSQIMIEYIILPLDIKGVGEREYTVKIIINYWL